MSEKYWVPALERAHHVLHLIASSPAKLRLMDLSRRLDIHKSSMFSLLHTLERLQWIRKEKDDTYSLGIVMATLGNAFFQQFDLVETFKREAVPARDKVGETVQLARRESANTLYLAKVEAKSRVQLISEPGMTFPAHATAMGKVLLSRLSPEELQRLYPDDTLPTVTPRTITDKGRLMVELENVLRDGLAMDEEEAVEGFCCVAAPVYNLHHEIEAAVSFSMTSPNWSIKKELAAREITQLAGRLSHMTT